MPSLVASVTPLPLSRDSRSLKAAHTYARAGHRSVVAEGWHEDETSFSDAQGGGVFALNPDPASPTSSAARAVATMARRQLVAPVLRLPFADLYHLHEYSMFPAVWARARLRRTRARILYDAHDFYPELERPASAAARASARYRVNRRIEARCIARSDAFITVSEGLADLFEERYGRRPVVVRNCHDGRLDGPVSASLRERFRIPEEATLVATVGRYKPGMRMDLAAAALSTAPAQLHWAFIGPGYDSCLELQAARVRERIHLVGGVAPSAIVPLLRGADVAAILYDGGSRNLEECLPNGLFQSLAAGLPVVYPALPGMRSLAVEHELGEAYPPGDAAALSALLAGLTDLRARSAAVGRSAAARKALVWEAEEAVLLRLAEPLLRR